MRKRKVKHYVPDLLKLYTEEAHPWLAEFSPNTCIEQTRVFIECMRAFGVAARPVETCLVVRCDEHHVAFACGLEPREKARARATAKQWIEKQPDAPTDEEGKHLVAIALFDGEYFVVESTIAQASAPDFGLVIHPGVLVLGPLEQEPRSKDELKALFLLGEAEVEVWWRFEATREYESTPAWEPSHLWPLIHVIVEKIKCRIKAQTLN